MAGEMFSNSYIEAEALYDSLKHKKTLITAAGGIFLSGSHQEITTLAALIYDAWLNCGSVKFSPHIPCLDRPLATVRDSSNPVRNPIYQHNVRTTDSQ